MTIKEMHYDFKMKYNKLDSNEDRNMLIPEIDWLLNRSAELFVKMVAEPRYKTNLGFETSQRNIDDIRPLVRHTKDLDVIDGLLELPEDYHHYTKASVLADKGSCINVKCRVHIRQHDDDFENSPFDRSSFTWRFVNGLFYEEGLRFYTEDFTIKKCNLDYIRYQAYMHNAENFRQGQYRSLSDGAMLSGSVNCELPSHTHSEIVDIAVLLAAGQNNSPDYQIKLQKLNLNNLK